MSKDHKPDTFHRPSGYQSDFEKLQADPQAKWVNYNSANESLNFYVKTDRGHHHVFYEPKTGRSGLHFDGHPTKNNHPKDLQTQSGTKEEPNMANTQDFRNTLKVDYSQQAQNADAKAFAAKAAQAKSQAGEDSGGREIGDERGPAKGGRENGNKVGEMRANIKSTPAKGKTSNGKTASNSMGKGSTTGAKGAVGSKGGSAGKGGSVSGSGTSGGKGGTMGGMGSSGSMGSSGGKGGHGGMGK